MPAIESVEFMPRPDGYGPEGPDRYIAYGADRIPLGMLLVIPGPDIIRIPEIWLLDDYGLVGGGELLGAFSATLEPATRVIATVDHHNSLLVLKASGYLDSAFRDPSVRITDPEFLVMVPMVRLAESGGFTVNAIGFEREGDDLSVYLDIQVAG
ncbi:hypothetical protein A2Z33_05745 [Candidatus Gottesmanbacteria bacterium RBG_16_52_11]|uniref:Uncharacterized protein n=1 Tax=Candidatus Gottesmanbacteria bacterium RBG_16_52_11 TaxID=1798374 RepID=A0A1F5YXU7_9BACT|nr:MAG: hypothetical protein A2Z33_05745 [Candidatus Gottesmanbacteria bacterium RBG_16_52_11]